MKRILIFKIRSLILLFVEFDLIPALRVKIYSPVPNVINTGQIPWVCFCSYILTALNIVPWEGCFLIHYGNVIMGAFASQNTILTIVSQPFIQAQIKKTPKLRVTGLCAGNSPVIGEFPAQ